MIILIRQKYFKKHCFNNLLYIIRDISESKNILTEYNKILKNKKIHCNHKYINKT